MPFQLNKSIPLHVCVCVIILCERMYCMIYVETNWLILIVSVSFILPSRMLSAVKRHELWQIALKQMFTVINS